MVHWAWLIVAAMIGGAVGMITTALLAANGGDKHDDM